MTTEEIRNRIDKLEWERFYLACKDRWLPADWTEDNRLYREITDLETMLKEREQ